MKKIRIVSLICLAVIAAAVTFSFAACAEQPEGVLLDRTRLVLRPGEKETLAVSVVPEGYSHKYEVVWSVAANPEDCVTVNKESGEVIAVKIGVAVVTATVSTKFGALKASCAVMVEGAVNLEFTTKAAPAAVARLNEVAPSGVKDGEVQSDREGYYYELTSDQVAIWNKNSKIVDESNRVLAAYKAVKGNSTGATVVKSTTKGQKDSLVMYIAVGTDGKLLAMRIDAALKEDFYADDEFVGLSAENRGNALSELTAADFTKHLTKKEGAGEDADVNVTANACLTAVKLAAELFAAR